MKKNVLLFSLFFAIFALLKMQTSTAQSGYAINLPGGSAGASSNMLVPALNTFITDYPFTIEMWVNPGAITAYDGFFYDKSATKTCFQFANATTGELRFDLFGGANVVPLTSAKKLSVGKWQHLAVTVYKDSAVVEIDGSFYAAAHTRVFANFCTVAPTFGWDKDVADRAFGGFIDDIRIWKSARSRGDVLVGKTTVLTGSETDLVAYYNFDDNTANDKTANVLNGTVTGGTLVDLNAVSTLSNITVSGGTMVPAFSPSTTSYTVYAPADILTVTVTGMATSTVASVTNNPSVISSGTPSVVMNCTSGDGLSTTDYTVNFVQNTIADWDANGATGASSVPSLWGWNCSNSTTAWTAAGSGANRYQDLTSGWYFNNISTPWTGRILYLRWDGVGGTNINSVFTYPVYLESCKTYDFTTKLAWVNNSTLPTLTLGFCSDKNGTDVLISDTAKCLATKQYLRNKSLRFSPPTTGVYYISIKSSTAALCAITDLTLTEGTLLAVFPKTLSLSNVTKTAEIIVRGNAITSDVTLSAPAGITLSRTTVPFAETPCGASVTVTYDYTQDIASGKIYLTSDALKDSVSFTFTKPAISIYEKNIEVEDNGRAYPLSVKSIGNSVDSLFVTAPVGFSIVKDGFSTSDFVSGSGSINVQVNSSATIGSQGKLFFYYKSAGVLNKLDSVNVTLVAAYPRYIIKHKSSGFVLGDDVLGLYPALTSPAGSGKQKFFMRRVNIDPLAVVDTFNIVQDDAYRTIRKSTTINPNWDTEFGVPSAEAKWTRQDRGAGIFTIANTLSTKVLGSNDNTLGARLYYDKTYTAGGFTEWLFIDYATVDSTLSSISLSTGSLTPAFSSTTTAYTVTLPAGTTTVTPTAVPTVAGATITGADAVDVTSGAGVSTIVVTATDGMSKMTYTIDYTVAKSDISTLSALTYDGTAVNGFAPSTLIYNVELPAGTVTVPVVVATTSDANANAVVTPAAALPGTTSIEITAEDGITKTTYSINFTVAKSSIATLSDLTADGTTVEGFKADSFIYEVILPSAQASVPLVAGTTTDPNATIVVTPAATIADTTFVVVKAEDGVTTLTYKVTFDFPVGVEVAKENAIKVYPSITGGSFIIEATTKVSAVTVYDLTGKVIAKKGVDTNTIEVAKAGIYFIKVESNGKAKMVKVVKTN